MKILITIALAVLFTGAITSPRKKENVKPETFSMHSFALTAKRDLASAD
ncbi:hypothetical protein [Mucilaginibacter sp. SP1R1]|nr:hypothetical protein [Mucilaginibacter sp. SP1R1]